MPINELGQFVRLSLAGNRYGTATIRDNFKKMLNGGTSWEYGCDCGFIGWAWAEALKRQPNFTCPECRKAIQSKMKTIHGHRGKKPTRTYSAYQNMHTRCYNKNHKSFITHGARGIIVCDRWHSFPNFLEDMRECPDGLEVERIDNDGNYEPGNCKWGTDEEQSNNKRNNVFIEFNGKEQTISQWARELGMDKTTIRKRLNKGWPTEKVLSQEKL